MIADLHAVYACVVKYFGEGEKPRTDPIFSIAPA
jgi:hypothetical protein